MSGRVFISYFREDWPIVKTLVRHFDRRSIPYWVDDQNLNTGDVWDRSVEDRIRNASAFLFCMSQTYYDRPNSYVHKELEMANAVLKGIDRNTPWFLPVALDAAPLPPYPLNSGILMSQIHAVQRLKARARWRQKVADRVAVILGLTKSDEATLFVTNDNISHYSPFMLRLPDPSQQAALKGDGSVSKADLAAIKVFTDDETWRPFSEVWAAYIAEAPYVGGANPWDFDNMGHGHAQIPGLRRFRQGKKTIVQLPPGRHRLQVAEIHIFEKPGFKNPTMYFPKVRTAAPVEIDVSAGDRLNAVLRKTARTGLLWRHGDGGGFPFKFTLVQ